MRIVSIRLNPKKKLRDNYKGRYGHIVVVPHSPTLDKTDLVSNIEFGGSWADEVEESFGMFISFIFYFHAVFFRRMEK